MPNTQTIARPTFTNPTDALRYHVSGAVARGEVQPIVGIDAIVPTDADLSAAMSPADVDAFLLASAADAKLTTIAETRSGRAGGFGANGITRSGESRAWTMGGQVD